MEAVEGGEGTAGDHPRPSSHMNREEAFVGCLNESVIDLRSLQQLAMGGVPDNSGLRARTWKLLLNYLPPERSSWDEILAVKRRQYREFCDELLVQPGESDPSGSRAEDGSLCTIPDVDDDPLSTSRDSAWNNFFKDNEVKDQIARDVERTHPDIHFFNNQDGSSVLHQEAMKRALFIFAKLNPGLAYVQGMNELYAPLLWTFRTDPDEENAKHAEADAFYCFTDIMSEFRDHFCKQLDNSSSGIKATMKLLSQYVQDHDYELWNHLENTVKIDPQYFAFRWITLMLTQEFHFPDLIRLWDTFLADPRGRTDALLRMCLVMMISVRDYLLGGDFASNLKLLQHYPPTDVNILLQRSASLTDPINTSSETHWK